MPEVESVSDKIDLSVIVCTHNPHTGRLGRTLQGLRGQDLEASRWELLLIDNASERSLREQVMLEGIAGSARVVEEPVLGLTHARLRGIREARGELLVFVDDDNILNPDYLRQAFNIAAEHPQIGVWGGRILPDYEVPPAPWAKPHLYALAIRDFSTDAWASWYADNRVLPCGAGMCVRRLAACHYADLAMTDPRRLRLDRAGNALSSSGDTDLALTVLDQGYGMGQFVRLGMTHIIPESRLTLSYFEKLYEGMGYSHTLLTHLREGADSVAYRSWIQRIRSWKQWILHTREDRLLSSSLERGRKRALKLIRSGVVS